MKKSSLNLEIAVPSGIVFIGEIQFLTIATDAGWLKILPGHAALVCTLSYAPLRFLTKDGLEEHFVARGGILKISLEKNSILISTLDCQAVKEMKLANLQEYFAMIKQELNNPTQLSKFKLKFLNEEKLVLEKLLDNLSRTKQ